ncbi:hypothetical protein LCGC14_2065580 [marine sediment metagenome]|uniref:Uncharacterized protein n=1 Tax=marine sediment metagenome TaxID=412755 RepID=A0A0F9EJV0_9ZZZZ
MKDSKLLNALGFAIGVWIVVGLLASVSMTVWLLRGL